VPVCTGENSMCIAPEAGIRWTGAAVVHCQGEQYVGPWNLILERQIGGSFHLQTACDTTIDDQCMGTLVCGACSNGTPCNPQNNTCCPMGFMSDGWGGCVCAPPNPKVCPIWFWDTTTCSCMPGF
jgi:hypothetical protein